MNTIDDEHLSKPSAVGLFVRYQDMDNVYYAAYNHNSGQVQITRRNRGEGASLGSVGCTMNEGTEYNVTFSVYGNHLDLDVDGSCQLSVTDSLSLLSKGTAGLYTKYAAASFDDFIVTNIAGTSTLWSDDFDTSGASDWKASHQLESDKFGQLRAASQAGLQVINTVNWKEIPDVNDTTNWNNMLDLVDDYDVHRYVRAAVWLVH